MPRSAEALVVILLPFTFVGLLKSDLPKHFFLLSFRFPVSGYRGIPFPLILLSGFGRDKVFTSSIRHVLHFVESAEAFSLCALQINHFTWW